MLDKRLTIEILNTLYDQGNLCLSELTQATEGNWDTVLRRVAELRAEGLIHTHKSDKFPFKRTVWLTNEGRKTASKVKNKLASGDILGVKMPQKGQKTVTVPEDIYERVREEVESGKEKSIARTFVKAVNEYLSEKYEYAEELEWLSAHKEDIEKLLDKSEKLIS